MCLGYQSPKSPTHVVALTVRTLATRCDAHAAIRVTMDTVLRAQLFFSRQREIGTGAPVP